jgi:hypothetical protein
LKDNSKDYSKTTTIKALLLSQPVLHPKINDTKLPKLYANSKGFKMNLGWTRKF